MNYSFYNKNFLRQKNLEIVVKLQIISDSDFYHSIPEMLLDYSCKRRFDIVILLSYEQML